MNIYDLISRAQKLRKETQLDSVSPDRVGGLHEDTLKYINEFQLLASSPSLHKIYASVSAMQSDKSPKSDLTGKPLKPGQLVVIVPANQTDATVGDVYRYDGPSGNTSAWTFVAKIGAVPADAELSATSTNPPQNKVVTEKLTELESEVEYDVSANNDGATFSSLSALLSSENLSTLIPTAVRCGGMSIRFVQSSDNKYVQYRLPNKTWSTDASDWVKYENTTINVNVLNNKSDAYDSNISARAAIPYSMQEKGVIITYLLADGWHTEQMIGDSYASLDELWNEYVTDKDIKKISNWINVNVYNNKIDAYASTSAARAAIPTELQKQGLVITYLLSDGWHTEQFIDATYGTADSKWKTFVTDAAFIQSEMGIYNVSKAYPTGGTNGTNVYTREAARAIAWNLVEKVSNKQGTILCYLTTDGWIFEQLKNNVWSSGDSYWQPLVLIDENDYYEVYITNIEDFNVLQRGRYVANGENNGVNDVWFRFEGTLYIHSKWNNGHLYAITKQSLIDAGVTLSQGSQMFNCKYGWQIMLNLKTGAINYFNSGGNVYRNYYTALLLAASIRDSNDKPTLTRGVIADLYNKQIATYFDSLLYPDIIQPNMQKVIEDKCNEIASASNVDDVIFTITSDMHGTAYEGTATTDMSFRAVNYIAQKINPLFHIDLGDSISQQEPFLNKTLGLSNFRSVAGNFRIKNKLFLVGNHDYNSYPPYYRTEPVTPQNESFIFSDKEVYNSIGRCMDGRVVWGDKNKVYYYVDYDEYKLRIICLNTTDNVVTFDGNGDMTSADPMINPSIRQDQIDWFANVALDFTEKGSDRTNWHTLIFTHVTPSPVADMESSPFPVNGRTKDNELRTIYNANGDEIDNNVIFDLISAFKSGGSVNYSYAGPYYIYIDGVLTPKNQFGTDANVTIQKDFSTQGAMNLIGVISGHSHFQENYDYNGIAMRTIRGGAPIIANGEIPFSGDSGYAVAICRLSLSDGKLYIYYPAIGTDEIITF